MAVEFERSHIIHAPLQAGHRIKGILYAISFVEATVGSAADHSPVCRGVLAYNEDIDGEVEGRSDLSTAPDGICQSDL